MRQIIWEGPKLNNIFSKPVYGSGLLVLLPHVLIYAKSVPSHLRCYLPPWKGTEYGTYGNGFLFLHE